MRTLTSKMIKTGIKNGFTVKDFCTKHDIKGEGNFLIQLDKAFPNAAAADQALREIRKNEKERRYKAARKPSGAKKAAKSTTRKGDDSVEKKIDPLASLKSTEDALSSEVIGLENQHKELAGKRRDYLLKMREIQKEVDKVYAELDKQQSAYEKAATEANKIIKQMNQVSQVRAEKLIKLTSVREQIKKLETATVAVYEDCNFEVVDGAAVDFEFKEDEVSALTHRLMEEEICENLTIKQIKTLSKLLIISKNTLRKVEFIFDSSNLEKAYLASKPLSP